MAEYPEHNKLRAIAHFSQKIGEFLDWLEEQRIELVHADDKFVDSKEKLLARFFEIDLKKLEDEKRKMLEEVQNP